MPLRVSPSPSFPTNAAECRSPDSRAVIALIKLIDQLDRPYRAVVERAIFEPQERFDKFVTVPSSRAGHHSQQGGNLLHTIDVAETALLLASRQTGVVDTQVLLTAALLHDVGKVDEYEQTPRGTRLSDSGRLVGHKTMGCMLAWEALRPLYAIRKRQALAIINCIACSEFRSFDQRGPASLEAVLLLKADQISAAADLFRQSFRRGRGQSFYGYSHPHLRERPVHPCVTNLSVVGSSPRRADGSLPRWERFKST